ncbi:MULTISPECIES: hypothetical protein [unclassified Nocardia]|uniref:hypothetical protein n=1 Tax=unclassified Nocardia TaxID=2637762 RepID=UPI00278C2469|nr:MULTISPECIES: hypothetical protein [unclassified Nocardia]
MTSPNGATPEGAYTSGGPDSIARARRWNQATALAAMTGGILGSWGRGQDSVREVNDEFTRRIDDTRDAQLDLIDRIDLLEGVTGYCSLFLSKNWNVKGEGWRLLPFDTQLGPRKGADPVQSGILLAGKGLWRADAHVTWHQAPSGWGNTNTPASVRITVAYADTGQIYSEKRFSGVVTRYGPETLAFPHTFVIPQDGTFVVQAWAYHGRDWHWLYGGTVRSALSVNRWSTGTENAHNAPEVPDGGVLE